MAALLLIAAVLAEDPGYCEDCGLGVKGEVGPMRESPAGLLVCAVECGKYDS